MKRVFSFFGLCAYALGSIGGFGLAMYHKGYLFAACIAVLAVMAWPSVKRFYRNLTDPSRF